MFSFDYQEVSDLKLDTVVITNWVNKVISKYNCTTGEIAFIFCSDSYLLEINKEFLNHNYFTDIITFNYCEGDIISGDIFISIDTVNSNAKEYSVSFENELNRVIIHGVLHLLGFDDKTEEENEKMHELEDEALNLLKTISQ
ncbi:rRNA maturation RNase YbeY [Labilibacter sediminis]|nr:rRNA maturation RNase YbeY [Labilibacter sediminis]